MSWDRLARREVYNSPFMNVWEDSVKLPNGEIAEHYSVASLPDGVLVVATDQENRVILFEEYKYAVDSTVLTFPGGGIDEGEDPMGAARRELLEETGYDSSELEVITSLYPFPSKIAHTDYIVRARNARKVSEVDHSSAETIDNLQLVPVKDLKNLRNEGKLNTSYMIAALTLAFPNEF